MKRVAEPDVVVREDAGPARKRRWKLIFAAYVVLIAGIDLLAYLRMLPGWIAAIPHYDTIIHFLGLGFLGLATHRVMSRRTVQLPGLCLPVGPVIIAALASADEALQSLSTSRSSNLGDLAANLSGILVFYLVDRWLGGRSDASRPHHRRAPCPTPIP